MNKLFVILGLLVVGASASACATVTSANPGLQNATGESWYTKDKWFIVPLGTDVYYCPKGGKVCYLAQIQ